MKRFLAAQEPALTKKQLQAQLDFFVTYYNDQSARIEALRRRRPLEAFEAREKARPEGAKIAAAGLSDPP